MAPPNIMPPTNTVAPPGIMRQQARREREMAQQSAWELSQVAGVTDHRGAVKTHNFTGAYSTETSKSRRVEWVSFQIPSSNTYTREQN